MVAMRSVVVALALIGCTPPGAASDEAPRAHEPHVSRRGIELPGDAHGAWWDAKTAALYLTDDSHHEIVRWTPSAGFTTFAKLPAAGLGGIVRAADGRFLVTVFGFGTDGAVLAIASDGSTVTQIPGLDRARRRIGLAIAPDGELYVGYLIRSGETSLGGIARLDPAGGETTLVENLGKPVGVAATANTLYVSDQHRAQLVAYMRRDLGHTAVIAKDTLRDPDLVTMLPCGAAVVGSRAGTLYRVTPGGEVTTIATDFEQVRGTAYDPVGKRLFVVEHSVATSRHQLHVLPLECPR
jgi:sugar lactone lactonase YvrE